jgi:hypothetical protein
LRCKYIEKTEADSASNASAETNIVFGALLWQNTSDLRGFEGYVRRSEVDLDTIAALRHSW